MTPSLASNSQNEGFLPAYTHGRLRPAHAPQHQARQAWKAKEKAGERI
jgi:hypothetical protein